MIKSREGMPIPSRAHPTQKDNALFFPAYTVNRIHVKE